MLSSSSDLDRGAPSLLGKAAKALDMRANVDLVNLETLLALAKGFANPVMLAFHSPVAAVVSTGAIRTRASAGRRCVHCLSDASSGRRPARGAKRRPVEPISCVCACGVVFSRSLIQTCVNIQNDQLSCMRAPSVHLYTAVRTCAPATVAAHHRTITAATHIRLNQWLGRFATRMRFIGVMLCGMARQPTLYPRPSSV